MAGFPDLKPGARTSLIGGLLGGLFHTALAVGLWTGFGLDDLLELASVKPLYGLYVFLGMFALGFVPAVFYLGGDHVMPGLVVGSFLILSVVPSWRAGPAEAPQGGPTPFGFYILFWIGIIVLAVLAARFEHTGSQPSTP